MGEDVKTMKPPPDDGLISSSLEKQITLNTCQNFISTREMIHPRKSFTTFPSPKISHVFLESKPPDPPKPAFSFPWASNPASGPGRPFFAAW